MVCKLVSYCDEFNLPFNINASNEWSIEVSTLGWSSQLIHKYCYHTKNDYSDLALTGIPICEIKNTSVSIIVNRDKKINKFQKG